VNIPPLRDWSASARVGGVLLVAALGLDLVALVHVRRLRVEEPVVPLAIRAAPSIVIHVPDDVETIHAAANRSPFDLDTPVTAVVPFNAVVQQSEPVPARPRLVGTVVEAHGGGFVVVELADGRMQVVRIGERAGELRLRSVNAGEAVFDDARGARVSLRTPVRGSESRP
jgi:hypothetical protein